MIVLPARLHGPRSESNVLRTGGAVIERVTPPAPDFKLTLRAAAPGLLHLLTLTVYVGDCRRV